MEYNSFEGKVLSKLAQIEEHIANQPCKKHSEAIYGNGWIGLKTQVFILWGAFCAIAAKIIHDL